MTATHSTDDPYVSRTEFEAEPADRVDPVLWGDGPGPLDKEQLARFERDGFLLLPDLFSAADVEEMLAEATALAERWPADQPGLIREPDSDVVRSVFLLHRLSGRFRETFRDPRLIDPVRQILASRVSIHQSRINYKLPFSGKEFFWHSDFETWHVEDGMPRMRAVSASLFLTESHEFNGPLMLIPGSHKVYVRCAGRTPENHFETSLRKQQYGVPSLQALERLVESGGIVAPKGPAGSLLLFDCNTMHGSNCNLSPKPRINLFAVFNSVENALTDPFGERPPRPEFLAERKIVPVEEL